MTAAHCLGAHPRDLSVSMGNNRLDKQTISYPVKWVKPHERYSLTSTEVLNDVGLVRIDGLISFGRDHVANISLASSEPADGEKLTLYGWGLESVSYVF